MTNDSSILLSAELGLTVDELVTILRPLIRVDEDGDFVAPKDQALSDLLTLVESRMIRAALPAGNEPVAWADGRDIGKTFFSVFSAQTALYNTPLYASPLTPAEGPAAWQSDKLGAWLSAALDDPMVADEYKQAINDWFAAGQPVAPLDWRSFLRLIDKHQYAFERVPAAWNAFVKLRNEVCALTPAEGETDWQLQAMRETLLLMAVRDNALDPVVSSNESLSPAHLWEMLKTMERGVNPQDTEREFSKAKMGRWLGWAQASVVAMGLATLDDMKAINMRCSAASRPTPTSGETGHD